MKDKLQYIIIGLLVVIFVQPFFSVPEGLSEAELEYQLELDSLKDERINDLIKINQLENKNKVYENLYDSLQNDNSIDTATVNQLESALSNYANSRR